MIPLGKDAHRDKATLALNIKILEMLALLGPNDLFVFSYGGHSINEYDNARFGDFDRLASSNKIIAKGLSKPCN